MKINLFWKGPYSYGDLHDKTGPTDYGIYQIYGHHSVYGAETLVYIGQANGQTFFQNFRANHQYLDGGEGWEDNGGRYSIHLGRIHLKHQQRPPDNDTWEEWIDLTERLLIYAHSPAWNSQHVFRQMPDALNHGAIHVLNWGQYGKLLPEVSGARFTSRVYDHLNDNPLMYHE